ncbi:MAG: hypothetical protein GF331_12730 [Chitinivibrionales bacterium]|nr:hypothetical protein [Chitinivibrionales bacterium]
MMTRSEWRRRCPGWRAALRSVALVTMLITILGGCREREGDGTPPLQQLAMLGESAWGLQAQGTTPFDSVTLFDLINGAAESYTEHGLVSGYNQELTGEGDRRVDLYVMSLKEAGACGGLLDGLRETVTETMPVPGFADSDAFAASLGPACNVYACQPPYFVEAHLFGYESCDEALEAALLALSAYEDALQ